MRANELNLALPVGGKGPLYLQVAQSVVEAVESRRIGPGMALPGVRDLAERLGVTVNTVLAALRELQAQCWVESRERVGFFIADPLPVLRNAPASSPAATWGLGFEIPSHMAPITSNAHVTMDLTEGVADARLAPTLALGRAYQRALKLKGVELLGTTDPQGQLRLRENLAGFLRTQRALRADPGCMLVLSSVSMAVALVAQTFLGQEDGAVAVESPGNPAVWEVLRQNTQAEICPLRVDGQGARPEDLEALLAAGRPVRLVVLSPQCHVPTGAVLSANRRAAFLSLARIHRIPILELDPEFDFLSGHAATLRPLAAEAPGQVVYVGDLSRILAPGVRCAYLVAPEPLLARLARARRSLEWQGDPLLEWALSELLVDGEIPRQLLRVRKAAGERREALEDALRHAFGSALTFRPAGMGLWLEGQGMLADPSAFTALVRSCQSLGLKLRPGAAWNLDQAPMAATRMGYTAHTAEELQRAVALMG